MEITVTLAGGQVETATVLPIDIVMTERALRVSLTSQEGGPSFEQSLHMAYSALKRSGVVERSTKFDEFLATVEALGDESDEETAGPLDSESSGS